MKISNDDIKDISIGIGTCPNCDQYPYSDTDNMCPVCGQELIKEGEIK